MEDIFKQLAFARVTSDPEFGENNTESIYQDFFEIYNELIRLYKEDNK